MRRRCSNGYASWRQSAAGSAIAVGVTGGPAADKLDGWPRQATYGGQRLGHRTDLAGHPALIAEATGRVVLHRFRQADAELLRQEHQWPPAGQMS